MLSLPRIALVCYEAMAVPLAQMVMVECEEFASFGDKLFWQGGGPRLDAHRTLWHKIAPLISKDCTHILNIEWDAAIVDPVMWSDEFLLYDYIGAPWPWHPDRRVGNGGFSLRSLRLLRFLAKHERDFPIRSPEDEALCRVYRSALEMHGFRWAPEEVAARFAYEREIPRRSFGMHGIWNWPDLGMERLRKRLDLANDYVRSKPEWRELRIKEIGKEVAKGQPSSKKISFVAASRNDDHGGRLAERTQAFINSLAAQCERHGVEGELILVEWNPPEDRQSLADSLIWPQGKKGFSASVVTVPSGLHARMGHADVLPFYQMIAKNVGIRHATGDFVVATNVDIVFSDELFNWLASGDYRPGVFYRSDRHDVVRDVCGADNLDDLLRQARRGTLRIHLREGSFLRRGDADPQVVAQGAVETRSRPMVFNELPVAAAARTDRLLEYADIMAGNLAPAEVAGDPPPLLHINGCGDFTMGAREDWLRLRGYPEWDMFSWNIDAAFVFQAYFNGFAVQELSGEKVHYHIEHDGGWSPERNATALWDGLCAKGIPYVGEPEHAKLIYRLREHSRCGDFVLFNPENWGFADEQLEVRQVVMLAADGGALEAEQISELGQDSWVLRQHGDEPGFFIEVGAHDGLFASNTLLLEGRGWHGILVEANPELAQRCEDNRPNCEVIVGAAWSRGGERLKFRAADNLGALECVAGGDMHAVRRAEAPEIEVETVAINDILARAPGPRIDYLSLDIEGAEVEVLRALDFARLDIRRLTVEHNGVAERRQEIRSILERNGFRLMSEVRHEDWYERIPASVSPAFNSFLYPEALALNKARLDHLASLNLPLKGKTVLEVGAGIGLLAGFFEERGCKVVSIEGRPGNAAEIRRRYPHRKVICADVRDLILDDQFDIAFCYGLLYHVDNPDKLLTELGINCRMLLLETMISDEDGVFLRLALDSQDINQALDGKGCRPTKKWLDFQLSIDFPFVYIPKRQPDHPDFPHKRIVAVASREPLNLLVDADTDAA